MNTPAYGPGHPEFDAKFRARWLKDFRELISRKAPDMTDEQFEELVAKVDKVGEQFKKDLEASRARQQP